MRRDGRPREIRGKAEGNPREIRGKCDEQDNGKGSGDSETREMAEQANQMKPFIKCKTFLGATSVTKGRQFPKKKVKTGNLI